MKRLIRLKPGHYLEVDSYRRGKPRPMTRPQFSPTLAIFASFTLLMALAYGSAFSRFVSDAASYQSAPKPQGRPIDVR